VLPAMPRRLQAASDESPSATSFYAIDGLRLCRLGEAVAFQSTLGPEMARPIPAVLYVASMVAVTGTDLLFFRNRIWEQLMDGHRHRAGVRPAHDILGKSVTYFASHGAGLLSAFLPVFRTPSASMILGHAWPWFFVERPRDRRLFRRTADAGPARASGTKEWAVVSVATRATHGPLSTRHCKKFDAVFANRFHFSLSFPGQ